MNTLDILKAKANANVQRSKAEHLDDDDDTCIGAHADYRREDFVFSRTQSIEMRGLEWESRLKPLKPWVPNFAANLAFAIFA
ncbi:MAG: hypothetical protein JOZ72_08670 [Alphaproteobacteria bacterium]|nr:hypothetical protein [Alphaproteobacteria bacterium]